MITGIELGGTKTVVAISTPDGEVAEECRFPTTTPQETLAFAADWLRQRGTPAAIGVASFGPIHLSPGRSGYGTFLNTPKPGWSQFPLVGVVQKEFPTARVVLETDVNAAALAEARIGAARGCDDVVYITIGTGIGAGILSGGRLVHGALHPEVGHFKVPHQPGDDFPGICPFHGDCLEGMASGPAIAARWGKPAHELPSDHPAWDTEAWYLAQGILALAAIVAPEKVVVGGGVSMAPGLHAKIQTHLQEMAAGYFPAVAQPSYVVPPALEQEAGIRGAFLLTAP